MVDLTVGPRAQNLAHSDPVVTAGAGQFPAHPDPVVTAGTTQFPPPVFSDPVVSGGAQLPPAHSDPVPPQPTSQFPHPMSAQPPGPSPMFPVMQQGVAMPRPSAPRPFRTPANVSEGECCVNHLAYHFHISPQPPSPPHLPSPPTPQSPFVVITKQFLSLKWVAVAKAKNFTLKFSKKTSHAAFAYLPAHSL